MRLRRTLRQVQRSFPLRLLSLLILTAGIFAVLLVWSISGGHDRKERQLIEELQRDYHKLRQRSKDGRFSNAGSQYSDDAPLRRGVVICAGGATLLANTYVSVHVLRNVLNSTLPIEIYHNGPADLPPNSVAAFKVFRDITFIDLSTLPWPKQGPKPSTVHGYVQKVLSLYSTQFSQVLLLDADSQPLRDPAALFESPAFHETGNLFWSDFWREGFSESPEEAVYQWLGLKAPWTYMKNWRCAETGQVFFDRVRHADVMEWLWFLNSHSQLLYKHMLGDKDTFEIAFILAGKEQQYSRVPHGPGLPTSSLQPNIRHQSVWTRSFGPKEERKRYLRLGMLQFDPLGQPAFLHRTERTKFAAQRNGYKLDIMRPIFWAPPISTALAAQIRDLSWRMHSIPLGLADVNCSCCTLDLSGAAVVKQTGHTQELPASTGAIECKQRVALFPIAWLEPRVLAAIDGGFTAFRDFASKVKVTHS